MTGRRREGGRGEEGEEREGRIEGKRDREEEGRRMEREEGGKGREGGRERERTHCSLCVWEGKGEGKERVVYIVRLSAFVS